MNVKRRQRIFFVCFMVLQLLCLGELWASDRTDAYFRNEPKGNGLNETKWDQYRKDYKYKVAVVDTSQQNKGSASTYTFGSAKWMGPVAYGILGLLFAGIILMVLRFRYQKSQKLKEVLWTDKEADEGGDITQLDLEEALRGALSDQNYKLAVRIFFLRHLKRLYLGGSLIWKKYYTNSNYFDQLSGNPIQSEFKELSIIYEKIWYGNRDISYDEFRNIETRFNEVKRLE